MARKREFWESEDFQDYFAGGGIPQTGSTGGIPGPYQPPDLDVAKLQEQMIAPTRREYRREVPRFEARLAKRKMGRSGAYWRSELDTLRDYLTDIGGPSADIALRTAALEQQGRLGWAQLGLTQQQAAWKHEEELKRQGLTQQQIDNEMEQFIQELQFEEEKLSTQDEQFEKQLELQWAEQGLNEQEINDKKEMFYSEQKRLSTQFDREYNLTETEAAWRHEEELSRQGLTQQQIDDEMARFDQQLLFEMDKFGRTLTQEDRQFEKQMELQWAEQGLNQQEVDDKKEMFYDQMAEMTRQWGHEFSFRQTAEMTRHEEEMGRQGLTQQELDNEMDRFDTQLEWEKDHYDMVLTEQQRQFNDEMANAVRQTDLSFDQLRETVRQFDENMDRLTDLDAFEMRLREGWWDEGYGPDDPNAPPKGTPAWDAYEAEHYNMGERDMEWWQVKKAAELKEIELDMMHNEIFGSWDEGFGPEGFEGDKYEWDEETESWVATAEWDKYMLDYYHKGQLDLREWGLRIEAMLGMVGVIPGEEEAEANPPGPMTGCSYGYHLINGYCVPNKRRSG